MSQRNAVIGFILAPLAPSVFFAIGALILGMSSDVPSNLSLSGYLLGSLIWFIYAIVVAYPVTLIIGVPSYLLCKKLGITNFKSYLIGGVLLGGLAPFSLVLIVAISEILNFNYWLFLISSFFGAITCATFWLITVKKPNKALKSDT